MALKVSSPASHDRINHNKLKLTIANTENRRVLCDLYLNVREWKDTMIIAAFPKVPILINFLSKNDYITLLKTQITKRINNTRVVVYIIIAYIKINYRYITIKRRTYPASLET